MYSSTEHSLQYINFTPGKVPKCYVCKLKALTKTVPPTFYFHAALGSSRYEKGLWNARSIGLKTGKRGLCGRYFPFVAEVEIRELGFSYVVGVMLVPRLRTDQALVYTISVNPLPPMQVCVTKSGGFLTAFFFHLTCLFEIFFKLSFLDFLFRQGFWRVQQGQNCQEQEGTCQRKNGCDRN